jgi:hypothetical protein
MIKKQQSKVNTSSASHREFQRRKIKQRTKTKKQKPKKNKNQIKNESSPTPVQGPSTVACMIVTSLSQLTH